MNRQLMLTGAAGALALLASAGSAAAAPSAPAPAVAEGDSCSLTSATITATATVEEGLTQEFGAYGDSGVAWTGGDSTYSVPLKDGSLAWIFSDTFLGPVAADGSRPETTPFLNNSIIVQDDGGLTTITGGTSAAPESLVGMDPDGAWHWFGAGALTPNGDLQVGVLEFARFGEGYWDWGWSENSLATIDTASWEVTSVDPLPSAGGVQWASWYERIGGHMYVYGVEDLGGEKYMHVAKVLGGDMTDLERWRYWDGTSWVRDETASVRVQGDVANEYSVTPFRDGYLLVTQDTSVPFSREVHAYTACSPQGPFVHATKLYDMPEVGLWGSYGDPDVIAYNAHEHPELRDGDTLLVTYNVNSIQGQDLYDDVTIYRPRFVEVALDVTLP